MDVFYGIGLIILILVAFNHMAGGRHSDVLRPFMDLAIGLLSMCVNLFIQVLRLGISAGGNSLKTYRRVKDDRIQEHTSTPPRW